MDNDALEYLKEVINQACYDDGKLDSMGFSTYSYALRYLASIGEVEIVEDHGSRVIAKWHGDKNGE